MGLISNITEFKKLIGGVQKNMDFGTWEPFISQAEKKFIVPVIGDELFTLLLDNSITDAYVVELRNRLKTAIAYFGYYLAIPQMTVVTGDAGIMQPSPGNTVVSPKWQATNLLQNNLTNGEWALEDALVYLEKHERAQRPDGTFVFEAWLESDAYKEAKRLFIVSATDMTKVFPAIQNSRRMYFALVGYMSRSEEDFVLPIIGHKFFKYLKNKQLNGEVFFDEENTVLKYLKTALAHHAFVACLPFVNVGENFRLISTTDGLTNEDVLTGTKLDTMKLQCETTYQRFSSKLVAYLNENATEDLFKDFFESPLYKGVEEVGGRYVRAKFLARNKDTDKHFVVL